MLSVAARAARPVALRTRPIVRSLAADAKPAADAAAEAAPKPNPPPPPPPPPRRGGGFFQRLTSFVAGAGLTALGTQYYIYEEIRGGNKDMISRVAELEKRLAKLEK